MTSIRPALPILAALAMAGCAPAPSSEPVAAAARAGSLQSNSAECRRAGGALKPVGKLRSLQCVISYADAGKSCTSGSQCAGDCRAAPEADVPAGQPVAGYCQPTSDRFGCSTRVENGRAEATICID